MPSILHSVYQKKKNTQEKQVVLACFYKICYNNGQESDKPSDSRVSYEPQHTYRTNAVPGYPGTAFFIHPLCCIIRQYPSPRTPFDKTPPLQDGILAPLPAIITVSVST